MLFRSAVPFASRSAPAAERGPSTAAPPGVLPALQWQERNLLGFGTTLSLRAGHRNAQQLSAALLAAIAEIRAIEQLMSLFDSDSAVCRLNTDGVLRQPNFRLLDVLTLARRVSKRSDGAFDVTMQRSGKSGKTLRSRTACRPLRNWLALAPRSTGVSWSLTQLRSDCVRRVWRFH